MEEKNDLPRDGLTSELTDGSINRRMNPGSMLGKDILLNRSLIPRKYGRR